MTYYNVFTITEVARKMMWALLHEKFSISSHSNGRKKSCCLPVMLTPVAYACVLPANSLPAYYVVTIYLLTHDDLHAF